MASSSGGFRLGEVILGFQWFARFRVLGSGGFGLGGGDCSYGRCGLEDWQALLESLMPSSDVERPPPIPQYEPWSKLLTGSYIGDYIGDYYRHYSGGY